MTDTTTVPQRVLDELEDLLAELPAGPWFVDDCEGELNVWPESSLKGVTRDENGEIDSYSAPGIYGPEELLLSMSLDTWDEGDDAGDDVKRRAARLMVLARNHLPGLLAELKKHRGEAS